MANTDEAVFDRVIANRSEIGFGANAVLADYVGNAKSWTDFDELNLTEGEGNRRVSFYPATIVALGLMVARG